MEPRIPRGSTRGSYSEFELQQSNTIPGVPEQGFRNDEEQNNFIPRKTFSQVQKASKHEESVGSTCLSVLRIGFSLIPAILFTAAINFIDDTMTNYQLFSCSFFVFHGIFWASFIFSIVECIRVQILRTNNYIPDEMKPKSCVDLFCSNGRWPYAILMQVCLVTHIKTISYTHKVNYICGSRYS